jgi:hypothetical protein
MEMDDVLAWHFDKKGCFSVKSAYRVHRDVVKRNSNHGAMGGAASSAGTGEFWKKLWKMDCMPKVKHFLWRLSHNTRRSEELYRERE